MATPTIILFNQILPPEVRLDYLQKHFKFDPNSPDVLIFSQPQSSIGIDQIRHIQQFLSTYPKTSTHKTIIILLAELITIPAQNSLLKTLEEPPEYAQIHLLTSNKNSLLDTIISRCHLKPINLPDSKSSTIFDFPNSPSAAITHVDQLIKNKQELIPTLESWVQLFRQQLLNQPTALNLFNLTLLLYTYKLIKQNANPKLVLDNLFFQLKSTTII